MVSDPTGVRFIASALLWLLAAHSYVGLFTQYMADDYCQAVGVSEGVWASQVSLYRSWQGTVASNLLVLLSGLVPPESVRRRSWRLGGSASGDSVVSRRPVRV